MERLPAHLHGTLSALAAPKRFDLLLLMLSGRDRSVSQLAEAVGLSQSCTTRHLQALARAGLVKGVRDGKRVVFRIAPRDAAARVVLASVSGTPISPSSQHARPAPGVSKPAPKPGSKRVRARRRRRASNGEREIPQAVLDAAVRIESAVELEPIPAEHTGWRSGEVPGERSKPESDRTSETPEPGATPAWRRSDLEDFLL